ncbi:hypothetical protein PUNSTDRAFT_139185 [Punctularia strigosozonata HHB-11173 SS5]|uniref:F-box domain-containing protein n=1 Tax=Punctularia strigosozonata (strain HHB-11173) TaxID=741275 RepID=R7S0G0_PUNST|nr:uncharacterized protein PUNSTDRAFT_139185 [Punctularia strigosozonata HHB-11173 SS5]EIN03880.1 hypothetical protein PUNSTDRAFT_139185 [Punctularia strigosozonata HHB-11173 SS5]
MNLRRSKRRRACAGRTEDDDDAEPEKPQKKMKRMKVKGRLAGLVMLPIDVMAEIFSHLEPLDILYLSWTSKDFNSLLMSRSSVFIWKSAFANVPDMPGLPPDMNEAQYARLAFAPLCSFCNRPNIRKIDWRLRCRTCASCNDEIRIIPTKNAIPVPRRTTVVHCAGHSYYQCLKSDHDDFQKERTKRLPDMVGLVRWEREQKERLQRIEEHAVICEKWSDLRATVRATELAAIRQQRYTEWVRDIVIGAKTLTVHRRIMERLTKMGWGEEIADPETVYLLREETLVKQRKALTEREWAKISDLLIKRMEQLREIRLNREQRRKSYSSLCYNAGAI